MPPKKKRKGKLAEGTSSRPSNSKGREVARQPTPVHCEPLFPPASQRAGKSTKELKAIELSLSSQAIYKDKVWVIDEFLTPSECNAWVSYAERIGFEEVHHPATSDTAYRENGRIEFMSPDVAARIWQRLKLFVPTEIGNLTSSGCYEKIRLYRYRQGQRFGTHIDESAPTGVDGEITGVTVLIYLNDTDLVGGETVFYHGNYGNSVAVSYSPKQGSLLFHGHGRRCLNHEARAVTKGAKYVLRTDVTYKTSS